MKIYRVRTSIFDYWYSTDRSGRVHEERFFSTRDKAEDWCEENKNLCYGYDSNEAKKSYEMPKFEIEEIEVE